MAYCDLCRRHFPSNFALEQHERDSPKHAITSDSESEEEGSVCPVGGCYEVRVVRVSQQFINAAAVLLR